MSKETENMIKAMDTVGEHMMDLMNEIARTSYQEAYDDVIDFCRESCKAGSDLISAKEVIEFCESQKQA